jgi:hypothetical protein
MFVNCKKLEIENDSIFILCAKTLSSNCYKSMFSGCTSLTTAPEIHGKILAPNCYESMFAGCEKLENISNISKLHAETLSSNCYKSMFSGCTSLTTSPDLPAQMLVESCYESMFSGCTNLNYIKMLATNIDANNCLTDWVKGVISDGGRFVQYNADLKLPIGNSGIPEGWTTDYENDIQIDEMKVL